MDAKQLVEKYANREMSDEEFDKATSELPPEQQEVLKTEGLKIVVEKIKSARRGVDKIEDKKVNQVVPEDPVLKRLKEENLKAAKSKFFAELGIDKEEEQNSLLSDFKSESVNVESIMEDLAGHYAKKNSKTFLDMQKQKREAEVAAEEENARNAGGGGSGGGGDKTMQKVDKVVKDYIAAQAKLGKTVTVEQAQRALNSYANKGKIS